MIYENDMLYCFMYDEKVSLISIHQVRSILAKEISFQLETEKVPTKDALGRRLGERVFAPSNLPESARSAMDGYAVAADWIREASENSPVTMPVKGEIHLGEEFKGKTSNDSCIKIPTGGAVPPGFDTVVPVEFTKEVPEGIQILKNFERGSNVDLEGSFHRKGNSLLWRGKILGSNDIAVLATLGLQQIRVQKKIRIGIAATGNELIAQGSEKAPGKVYDSNSIGIIAMLEETGLFHVTHYGILRDERASITSGLTTMLEHNDVVITVGGTALGAHDLIPEILSQMKPGIIFHGMKTRPGVPSLFAISDKKPVIGLPGPPVSAFLVMYDIFRKALLEKAGVVTPQPVVKAFLSEEVRIAPDKYNIVPVHLNLDERNTATPLSGSSAAVSRLSLADGYFTYLGDQRSLQALSEIDVIPFHL